MADEFDRYLASALAPENRMPDRGFVARVQSVIALEEALSVQRRALIAGLLKQLAALLAVAAGVWVVGRAEPVANWFAGSPALGLTALLAAFGAAVALFAAQSEDERNITPVKQVER
jgi:hypothetical protein